jgi:hypothetical protein
MSENSNSIFRAILTGSAWSFVGVLLAVAFFYWQEYRNPYSFKIELVDEFNLIEVREQISDLKILYKNDDIIESKKEIKVIRIQIRNEGDTILQGYYDQLEPFGLRFSNSQVLNAEVISTNSEDLQQKLVNSVNSVNSDAGNKNSDVLLSKVIFDAGDYATLKITVLSDEKEILNIAPLGKIANVDSLKIDVIQPEADEEKPVGLYVVGGYIGFIVFLFGLIAITEFFETRSKRNKVKRFLKDGESLTEVQSEITDYYMDMPPSQKRLIKALLNNDIALDLKQVIEAQTPKHSPIEKIFLLPLVITKTNRLRLQNLQKDIFSTDGVTVSFNKENEDFIRSFFGAVL